MKLFLAVLIFLLLVGCQTPLEDRCPTLNGQHATSATLTGPSAQMAKDTLNCTGYSL